MSNRPMRTTKRLIWLASIACAAAGFNAAPAGARIASTTQSSSHFVVIGGKWQTQSNEITCSDGSSYLFSYVQRATIDGVSAMVPVEFVYVPGRHALVLQDTCDDLYIYGVDSAAA